MNGYTRSNAHTQILRTVKDFPRILELNSEKQKRRPLPGVVRRTFHVLYVAPVQWSVSNRFSSYPEVELGLTGPTSISTNIRTTCSKSLAVFVSNDSSLSVRPRILVVEFAIAEMACVSRNVRRTFHVPSGVPVQRSISERDASHPKH